MLAIEPGEDLLAMSTAIERATGRRPHPTTCHRWRLKGTNGVKLPTVKVGGRRLTSVEAVHRWILASNQAEAKNAWPVDTSRRDREIAEAEAFLESEGV